VKLIPRVPETSKKSQERPEKTTWRSFAGNDRLTLWRFCLQIVCADPTICCLDILRHKPLGLAFRYRFPAKCEPSHLCNFNMEGPLKMIPKCTVNDGFRKWRKMNVVMSRHVGALAHAFRKLPRCQLENPGCVDARFLALNPCQTLESRPEIPGSRPLPNPRTEARDSWL